MEAFSKINEIVDNCKDIDNLNQVCVIINKERIKQCKFGKYTKPIEVIYKYEGKDDVIVDNPNYLLKIPSTQDDCIAMMGTKYTALLIDPKQKKTYIGTDNRAHNFYECSVGVIRNPVVKSQIEQIEQSAFQVSEFQF